MDEKNDMNEDAVGSALANVALLRATQVGRGFLTAHDFRVIRMCTKLMMSIDVATEGIDLGRPQTLPTQQRSELLNGMERALNGQEAKVAALPPYPPGKVGPDYSKSQQLTVETALADKASAEVVYTTGYAKAKVDR
jgi:hypothetical protein